MTYWPSVRVTWPTSFGPIDADDDDDDDPADANAKAGSCAATCRSLLHATLGSGAARLRLELGAADIPWCV